MHFLDFVMVGALKRTLSLAVGVHAMILAKNIACARALSRMHLDTVTRLLAYTYVSDPESVALGVISGKQLKKYKSKDGGWLTDDDERSLLAGHDKRETINRSDSTESGSQSSSRF